jgi:hypothetical protein
MAGPPPPLFLSLAKEPGPRAAEDTDQPVVGLEPLIIDSVSFALLNKWKIIKSSHYHVCVTFQTNFEGQVRRFAAYKSNSYMFWRLCILYDKNKKFYKGRHDYIQQTFLHLELQKYINANYHLLEEVDGAVEYERYSDPHFPVLPEEYDDHPFIPDRDPAQFDASQIALVAYNQSVTRTIDDPTRIDIVEPFYSFARIESNGCGIQSESRNSDLDGLGEKIESAFKLATTPTLVYKDYIQSYEEFTLKADIYVVKLQDKTGGEEVLLYFMTFSIDSVAPYNIHKRGQFAPIFLTSSTDVMLCGIYKKYIPAGTYICKIIDYDFQALDANESISETYKYIGDMYQNIYPYNQASIKTLVSKIGGASRKRKYKRGRGRRTTVKRGHL